MAFNTGNAPGSTDLRDLSDNSGDIDTWATDRDKLAHPDRLGEERKTWHGMEVEFDNAQVQRDEEFVISETVRESQFAATQADKNQRFADFIASSGYRGTGVGGVIEDYAAGIEFTEYNQVVRDSSTGEFWKPSGSTSLPYITDGTGLPEGGSLEFIGDAAIRQELATGLAKVKSGTGTKDISVALDGRPLVFNNIASLQGYIDLEIDARVRTLGFDFAGDGRGADYLIVAAGTGDTTEGLFIDLGASSLQAEKLSNKSLWLNNYGSSSTDSLADWANFPGPQRRTHVIHHYNDEDMCVYDNVGEDNFFFMLRNLGNPTRRFDKPADFIGHGDFLRCQNRMPAGAGGAVGTYNIFEIMYDGELRWPNQGSFNSAVELTNAQVTHNFDYSFRLQTETANTRLLELTESLDSPAFQFNSYGGTLARLDAPANMTSGLYLSSLGGAVDIDAQSVVRLTAGTDDGYFVKTPTGFGSMGRFMNSASAPSSPTSPGRRGDFFAAPDGSYVYFCYAPNSWCRIAAQDSW